MLAINILVAYTGISVFKMVCTNQQNTVHYSINHSNFNCEHQTTQEKSDCCSKKQTETKNIDKPIESCCAISFTHLVVKENLNTGSILKANFKADFQLTNAQVYTKQLPKNLVSAVVHFNCKPPGYQNIICLINTYRI